MLGRKSLLSLFAVLFLFQAVRAQPVKGDDDDDETDSSQTEFRFVDTIHLDAKPGQLFNQPLRELLTEPDLRGPVRWQVKNQPAWLSVSGDSLTGTPQMADAAQGTKQFTVSASTDDLNASSVATVTVLALPHWASADLDLGIINEDQINWSFDLNRVASDPAGGKLTFQAQGLPPWMQLDPQSGLLTGTPHRADAGHFTGLGLTATGTGGAAQATAHYDVIKTPHPPKWVSKHINLTPNAREDNEYTRDIKEFVLNEDGASLSFELVSEPPPAWLHIGAMGLLYGNPRKENVGTKTFSIRLTANLDGAAYDDTAEFQLTVDHLNHAPRWLSGRFDLGTLDAGLSITRPLGNSAKDADAGDTLTFAIVSFMGGGNNWATIDPNTGDFSGTPDNSNLGDNTWRVSVTDQGGLSGTTLVKIRVTKALAPPRWKARTTQLPNAREDVSYQADLTGYAMDPNPDPSQPIRFLKIDGPSWLSLSPSGILSGKPGKDAVGVVKLSAKVENSIPGGDITELQIFVEHTNHSPYWTMDPIFINAEESQPFSSSVALWAADPDMPIPGDKLAFSLVEGPSWAQLSSDGTFSGVPGAANEGDNRFKVRVADQSGEMADAVVVIHVPHKNHAPAWATPIPVAHAQEGSPYNVSIAQFAKDPDGDPLSFRKSSRLPGWLSVSRDGILTGTPARDDVGDNAIDVVVEDPSHAAATATIHLIIDKVLHPPAWRQTPVQLPDGYEDMTYPNFTLARFVDNPEHADLKYRKVSGPDWLFIGEDGTVTGVPMKKDIGSFTAQFEVSDGTNHVPNEGTGSVQHKNHPPIISPDMPVFTMKERQVFQLALGQPQYVSDPDGDKLNFSLEEETPPAWVTLGTDGALEAKPQHQNLGDHAFRFKATDGQVAVHGVLRLHVDRSPRAPVWLIDPMSTATSANQPMSASIAGADNVKDLDGLSLTFKKVSGPDWLKVDTDGTLCGTPADSDLGDNSFRVAACNDRLCAEASLLVQVKPGMQVETIPLDQSVGGAPTELVWVVDNAMHCDEVIRTLKENIHLFYEDLENAGLHHSGVFLSANAGDKQKIGIPIRDAGSPMLMSWNEGNIVADFNRRLDLAYSECGSNSPFWSLERFYERLPKMTGSYHKSYFMPGVPSEVMIVTGQRDHYRAFTASSALLRGYGPADFARDFVAFHQSNRKLMRVSAIAPECPQLIEGDPQTIGPENSYHILVNTTRGKYYTSGACDFDMAEAMHDYAARVVLRAEILAKRRIKLGKTPKETSSMRVSVGGKDLSPDQWSYEANPVPAVVIRWDLIGDDGLQATDQIRIEYRVS